MADLHLSIVIILAKLLPLVYMKTLKQTSYETYSCPSPKITLLKVLSAFQLNCVSIRCTEVFGVFSNCRL
jgi:hypothetical protein